MRAAEISVKEVIKVAIETGVIGIRDIERIFRRDKDFNFSR